MRIRRVCPGPAARTYLALGRAGIFGRSRHGCIALSSGCYCRYPSKFFRSRVSVPLLWVAHRNISRLFQREYQFVILRSCVLTPRNSEVADLWRAPRCFGERLKSLSQFLTNLVLLRPHRNFLPPVVRSEQEPLHPQEKGETHATRSASVPHRH